MAKNTQETQEVKHSPLFEKYQARFNAGGCTVAQLKRLTQLGVLTSDEFTQITGEDYD